MKVNLLIPFFLLPLIGATAKAQGSTPAGADAEQNLNYLGRASASPGNLVRIFDNRYEGIKGTPYFWPDWSEATITLDNRDFQGLKAKFNVYENNLVYLNDKGQLRVLEAHQFEEFELLDSLGQSRVHFTKVPEIAQLDEKYGNRFVRVLYQHGANSFIALPAKELLKADYSGPYSANRKFDEFIDKPLYFVIKEGQVKEVKLGKRSFFALFPENQNAISAYIRQQKIDMNSEQGWLKALAYYHGL